MSASTGKHRACKECGREYHNRPALTAHEMECVPTEFIVDRYQRGYKLAESCSVMAVSAADALAKAKALYLPRWPGDDLPPKDVTFVISEDFV